MQSNHLNRIICLLDLNKLFIHFLMNKQSSLFIRERISRIQKSFEIYFVKQIQKSQKSNKLRISLRKMKLNIIQNFEIKKNQIEYVCIYIYNQLIRHIYIIFIQQLIFSFKIVLNQNIYFKNKYSFHLLINHSSFYHFNNSKQNKKRRRRKDALQIKILVSNFNHYYKEYYLLLQFIYIFIYLFIYLSIFNFLNKYNSNCSE
ncbi:transmembrane protein, putative (macronuclear) [Tetrahymena thermophila SB210]|uniref:Transmembrane protein, putative n=1 Tax=Tetrahymena thermophila (strain SB210) TaxID=312017 RepID=W7X7L7_TETTS|nr:transmembrane protein, putative [Tetrahymena thermophila SB210]EWS73347.1 transmembrane protein, putative [Tetrahymena thermophila SB210]|eukprot:XP_012654119.1 transmembrane protein, putative [Tetrahymena thermophila SB210]